MKHFILNISISILLSTTFNCFSQETTNQAVTQTHSQEPNTTQPQFSFDKSSLDNQLNFIITYSTKYNEFKVVKESWLYLVKAHVGDTVNFCKRQIELAKDSLNVKNKIIDSLKSELSKSNDQYKSTSNLKDSLNFLGITLSKSTYNSLVCCIISVLILIIILLFLLFKRSNAVTLQTKQDLSDIKNDFEEHRKKALLREEKLARQYLDELNKYKR
jgi:preprotein translocase subunit SecF